MKAELDELYNKLRIKNVSLMIDSDVTELCKITNHTSSITRRSLYFSIIVSIFSIVIVLNTWCFSWTDARMSNIKKEVHDHYDSLIINAQNRIDTIFYKRNDPELLQDNIGLLNDSNKNEYYKQQLINKLYYDDLNKKIYGNYMSDILKMKYEHSIVLADALTDKITEDIIYPELPVLGTHFDVNNFGIILGIIFIFLSLIQIYGSNREIINTKIAFTAVTERYNSDNVSIDYTTEAQIIHSQKEDITGKEDVLFSRENKGDNILIFIWKMNKNIIEYTKKNLISMHKESHNTDLDQNHAFDIKITKLIFIEIDRKFNEHRRKYHYDFLTMNEIFNVPKMKISKENINAISFSRVVVIILHMIPTIIFSLIIYNDYMTTNKVQNLSPELTNHAMFCDGGFLIIIFGLCLGVCFTQYKLNKLYDNFIQNNYRHDDASFDN